MLLLGLFLLIAKYTNHELWGEGESGGTRWGEGLQSGAELPAKEKEKERRREKGVSDKDKYNFKKSGIGDSWLIGNDTTSDANAYVNGLSGCEENLEIPHELTDENQNTKKVEVIGQYAFRTCGAQWNNGITRSIVLSKYIKVIKYLGLGGMDDVTSFRIEEGSCLESIENAGLTGLNYLNTSEDARSGILVLPSKVTSIAADGLHKNNLIKTIYYCGSTHLSNYSQLMWQVSAPDIKVTNSYSYNYIFGNYTPKNDSSTIAEAEEKCRSFAYKPKASPSSSVSPSKSKPPTAKATATATEAAEHFTSVRVEDGLKVTGWVKGEERCPPSIDVPDKLWGVPVVAVNDSAFSGCNESKSVSLSRFLEKVGREAFAGCGANADAGFVLTVPSGANLSEGSFSNTNVEIVFW